MYSSPRNEQSNLIDNYKLGSQKNGSRTIYVLLVVQFRSSRTRYVLLVVKGKIEREMQGGESGGGGSK